MIPTCNDCVYRREVLGRENEKQPGCSALAGGKVTTRTAQKAETNARKCDMFTPRQVGQCGVCERSIEAANYSWKLHLAAVETGELTAVCSRMCQERGAADGRFSLPMMEQGAQDAA